MCSCVSGPKNIAEVEDPHYFRDLTLSDSWLFPKIKCLKGTKISGYGRQKKCDHGTESYSTTGIPKISNSSSIVGLSA
jgi:hypothetical protein